MNDKGSKHPDVLSLLESIILKNSLSALQKWTNKYKSADFKHLRTPQAKNVKNKRNPAVVDDPCNGLPMFHASQCPYPWVGLSHMTLGLDM